MHGLAAERVAVGPGACLPLTLLPDEFAVEVDVAVRSPALAAGVSENFSGSRTLEKYLLLAVVGVKHSHDPFGKRYDNLLYHVSQYMYKPR